MWAADGTVADENHVTNSDNADGNSDAYHDIKAAMLECAQMNTCAYVDIHGAFGRTPVTNGWIVSGDIHPSDSGHTKIADLLGAIL